MSLKSKVALSYLVPLILIYAALVTALAAKEGPSLASALKAVPAAVLCIACQLIQDVVPRSWKESLIFLRRRDRLPGCRAFTSVCDHDPRIPRAWIDTVITTNSMEPKAQNALWYGLYLKVSEKPQVAHENFRYLAWRDVTMVLWILVFASVALFPLGVLGATRMGIVMLCCTSSAIATTLAARNTAHSLVRNVVAHAAAGAEPSRMPIPDRKEP
jgi:hypothetical protein